MAHLTKEQRYTISVLLEKGTSKRTIAVIIGKHHSVIYNEISRNKDERSGQYKADLAEKKYRERIKKKPKYRCFTKPIKDKVDRLLAKDYSPEQITGTCKRCNIKMVSHETIYQYVWDDKKSGGQLHTHLRRQGRRYRKRGAAKDNRGIIKNRVSIEKRPADVEKKERFGDLEGDLIIGRNHKSALVTVNDRSAGMLKMKRISSKDATEVEQALTKLVSEWLPFDLRTLTLDNGKEFANHEKFTENTGIDVYFAHPYHSWERGSNENLNGLIRQYFPKKTDFSTISDKEIKEIEDKLNNRPRKRYGYDSPIEKMNNLLFNQSVAFKT